MAADCLPVALGCTGAVAMVHAGWRGLAAGVLEEGVAALRELAGEEPIEAIVGPCAGVCCYEVGAGGARDVWRRTPRGGHIDLRAIAHERLAAAGVGRVRDVQACTICDERFFSHRREGDARGAPGGGGMVELITGLRAETVRANLERIRGEIAAAVERSPLGRAHSGAGGGGDPGGDQVRGAGGAAGAGTGGRRLVGENRAQDLQEKVAAHGELFEWDFIGQLQSRRVRAIVPHVRLIHSVASESALRELERHLDIARPGLRILLEVNVAGEAGKAGIAPREIAALHRALAGAGGRSDDDAAAVARTRRQNRRWFAALRELARRARPRAPVDGHLAGLPRGGRRGRHDRAYRHEPLPLTPARLVSVTPVNH